MKSTLAISMLVASSLAGAIPGNVQEHIHRRAANPQPVCSFDEHSFNEANAWDKVIPASPKRDLRETTWSPPSNLVTGLKEVWDHQISTYSDALGFKNYGYDQVMVAKGKINYCVRWEGSTKVNAEQRTQVETAIRKQFNKWIAVLAGFEGFPYETADVNVVGWAVNDASILEGDVSNIDVYTDKDGGGIPQCAESCGRFFHQDNNYNSCKGGADRHYGKLSPLQPVPCALLTNSKTNLSGSPLALRAVLAATGASALRRSTS